MERPHGFSLFELLVVLVLMGLVVSLVAPSVSSLSRQAKIEAEVQSLSQLIYQISVDAYSTQSRRTLQFEGNELRVFLRASTDRAGTVDTKEQLPDVEVNEALNELGNQVEGADVNDEPMRTVSYEHLSFPKATVELYPTGLFDKIEVVYRVSNDATKSLKLVGVMGR